MGLLDDPDSFAFDRAGMVAHAEALGREFALAWESLPPLPARAPAHGPIAIAGMGGSGAAAAYAATQVSRESSLACFHLEGPRLPAMFSRESLVVACSYSGNTPEIIASAHEALSRGIPLVAVTGGGELRALATHEGAAVVPIGYESVPRAALGHLLAGVLRAVTSTGAIGLDDDAIAAAAAAHEDSVADQTGSHVPGARNPAKQFAARHRGGPTLIAAADHLVPAARRMANQLAENAKCLAVAASIPEMQHNLVETFIDGEHRPSSMVLFDSPLAHDLERRSGEHVAAVARDMDIDVHRVDLPGLSVLADLLAATAFGDLASCYLALVRGIDPTPIPVIDAIKSRFAAGTADG